MRRIGVLTSGGDAPGMNACIRAVVRAGLAAGLEVAGIRRGYLGLLAGELEPLDRPDVVNVIQLGGTILGTARAPRFERREGRDAARQILADAGIGGLVLIGGDGTLKGGGALVDEGGPACIGVPGTIDNDLLGTDRSLGFATAVDTALGAIDRIRDTATSHEILHVVEVMGRHSGWIALASGVAGGAEAIVVPETPTDLDAMADRIRDEIDHGKRAVLVVVAEGDPSGGAVAIADHLAAALDLESRATILGHVQRGGSPIAADRILGTSLGAAAVDSLLEGRNAVMVGEVGGRIVHSPFAEATSGPAPLDPHLLGLLDRFG
jgi:6-phosphofructokinase 1